MTHQYGLRVTTAMVGIAVVVAACAPATDDAQDTGTTSATVASAEPASGEADNDNGNDTDACVEAVAADVEAARADTPLLVPDEPLDTEALRASTIWYVTVTFNQFSSDWVAGLEEAAAVAGVEVVTFDGQGQVNRFNEGISQAVAQGVDGIIVAAIEPATISASLSEAEQAGIPVMNGFNSDPAEAVPAGMFTNFTSDFTSDGATAAKYALLDSQCRADMVVLTSSAVRVWDNMVTGAQGVFDEYCPEDCTLEVIDVDIANIATDIGEQLSTAFQRNPDIGYVLATGDSLVSFVDPVLATAGSDAKVIGRDGLDANIQRVASGEGQAMTLAMPPFGWLGWLAFDEMGRAIVGQPTPGYQVPARIIDSDNVGGGGADELFPEYTNYQEAFTEAWETSAS